MGGELRVWGIQPLTLPSLPDLGTYGLWNTFFRTNLTHFMHFINTYITWLSTTHPHYICVIENKCLVQVLVLRTSHLL